MAIFTFRPGPLVVGADLLRLFLVGVRVLVDTVALDPELATEAPGVVGLQERSFLKIAVLSFLSNT